MNTVLVNPIIKLVEVGSDLVAGNNKQLDKPQVEALTAGRGLLKRV